MYRQAQRVLLAGTLLLPFGCSAGLPRGEVEGKAIRNGLPLAQVLITFIPDTGALPGARRASGMTDQQGRFRLLSEDQRQDVVAGPYRVIVEDLAAYTAPRSPDGTVLRLPSPRLPPRFGDPLQTPVQVAVKAGMQFVEVQFSDT